MWAKGALCAGRLDSSGGVGRSTALACFAVSFVLHVDVHVSFVDEFSTRGCVVCVKVVLEDVRKSLQNNRWLHFVLYMWSSDFTMSTNVKLLSCDVVGGELALRWSALLLLASRDFVCMSEMAGCAANVVHDVRWTT